MLLELRRLSLLHCGHCVPHPCCAKRLTLLYEGNCQCLCVVGAWRSPVFSVAGNGVCRTAAATGRPTSIVTAAANAMLRTAGLFEPFALAMIPAPMRVFFCQNYFFPE